MVADHPLANELAGRGHPEMIAVDARQAAGTQPGLERGRLDVRLERREELAHNDSDGGEVLGDVRIECVHWLRRLPSPTM